jgi:rhamnogalacturonyl hydrolase YesR
MLAKAGGDSRYLATMHAFFEEVTGELFDRESGLYYRDKRYIGKRTANGKKVFWSRGNGWAFGGIAHVLGYLPQDDPQRPRYLEVFRRMAAELVRRQGADGYWRPNLDDPDDVAMPETSGTGFFCFGLAWGINHGILDRAQFLPAALRAWDALTRSVTAEGKVQWGQQVDAAPNPLKQESTHEYVTGTFLLAASEIYALAAEPGPRD